MICLRRPDYSGERECAVLLNNSVFHDLSRQVTSALELNREIDKHRWRARIVPQVHYDFSRQVGTGTDSKVVFRFRKCLRRG